MKKIKSKYIKALAILLSMAMLMTGLPAPIYAEEVATPTDTVAVLETVETEIEETSEQPLETPTEESEPVEDVPILPDEPEQPVELPPEEEPVTEPDMPIEESSDTPAEETPDEPIQEEPPADETVPADEPVEEQEEGSIEPPAIEDEQVIEEELEQLPEDEILIEDDPAEPIPEDEPGEETVTEEHPVKAAIDADGYAYLMADHSIQAFSASDMWEHSFTIEPGGILLVTAFIEQDGLNILEVQFLTPSGDLLIAYVYADDLPQTMLNSEDIDAAALTTNFALVFVGEGKVAVFAIDGMAPGEVVDDQPVTDVPDQPEQPAETPPVEDIPVVEPPEESEQPAEDLPELPNQTEQPDIPSEEMPVEPDVPGEKPEETPAISDPADPPAEDTVPDDSTTDDAQAETPQDPEQTEPSGEISDATLSDDLLLEELPMLSFDAPALFATPTYTFSLRDNYGYTGNFYPGQRNVYGSSGDDSYPQLAASDEQGTIYATPHYLDGVVVYCLEHKYPGPGERDGDDGYEPSGPYTIVDLDGWSYAKLHIKSFMKSK